MAKFKRLPMSESIVGHTSQSEFMVGSRYERLVKSKDRTVGESMNPMSINLAHFRRLLAERRDSTEKKVLAERVTEDTDKAYPKWTQQDLKAFDTMNLKEYKQCVRQKFYGKSIKVVSTDPDEPLKEDKNMSDASNREIAKLKEENKTLANMVMEKTKEAAEAQRQMMETRNDLKVVGTYEYVRRLERARARVKELEAMLVGKIVPTLSGDMKAKSPRFDSYAPSYGDPNLDYDPIVYSDQEVISNHYVAPPSWGQSTASG
jgi:hypothetical protein